MARYKMRRAARYHDLRGWGFLPFEARELSKIVDRSAGYFRQMVRDRKEIIGRLKNEADFAQWSKQRTIREIVEYLQYIYRDNRWEFNHSGVWQMYREYRDKALDLGEYYPKKRKRKHFSPGGSRIDRGNLRLQRQRYKTKSKERGY